VEELYWRHPLTCTPVIVLNASAGWLGARQTSRTAGSVTHGSVTLPIRGCQKFATVTGGLGLQATCKFFHFELVLGVYYIFAA
jgi:hypothetical protein